MREPIVAHVTERYAIRQALLTLIDVETEPALSDEHRSMLTLFFRQPNGPQMMTHLHDRIDDLVMRHIGVERAGRMQSKGNMDSMIGWLVRQRHALLTMAEDVVVRLFEIDPATIPPLELAAADAGSVESIT